MILKNYKTFAFVLCLFTLPIFAGAQGVGFLSGKVLDKNTQKPLAGATLLLNPGGKGVTTNETGEFRFSEIQPGAYSLTVTNLNYRPLTLTNIVVTTGNENILSIELEAEPNALDEVVVRGRRNTARAASLESPLSVQRLTIEDIKANPGGNFDISRVIQSLPGVGGGVGGGGFRNDIIYAVALPVKMYFTLMVLKYPLSTTLARKDPAVDHKAF
jgi:hypothetical protein